MYELVNIFSTFLPQLLLYPNPKDPLNSEAARLLISDEKAYIKKVKDYVSRYASPNSNKQKDKGKDTNAPEKTKVVVKKNCNDQLSETSVHNQDEDSDDELDDQLSISELNESDQETDAKNTNLGKRSKQEQSDEEKD